MLRIPNHLVKSKLRYFLFLCFFTLTFSGFTQNIVDPIRELERVSYETTTIASYEPLPFFDIPWRVLFNDEQLSYKTIKSFFERKLILEGIDLKVSDSKLLDRWKMYNNVMRSKELADGTFLFQDQRLKQIENHRKANNSSKSAAANFQFIGQTNSTFYTNNGRIERVNFHPTDTTIIWASAPEGGLWKSEDIGVTWNIASDFWEHLSVGDLVYDPTNHDVIYVATDDHDSWFNNNRGVLKSTDGGATWSVIGLPNSQATNVYKLLIHPSGSPVMACTSQGLFESTDGGVNWTHNTALPANINDLEFHPTNSQVIYATTRGGASPNLGYFYVSIDGGVTFTQQTMPQDSKGRTTQVTVSPNNPDVAYIGVYPEPPAYIDKGGVIMKYVHSTGTITNILEPNTTLPVMWFGGAWDFRIELDPADANHIIYGCVFNIETFDGGTTWTQFNVPHADVHDIKWQAGTDKIWVADDGGLGYTFDGGANWTTMRELPVMQFYSVNSNDDGTVMMMGAQDAGVHVSHNNFWFRPTGGDGLEVKVDPVDDNILYGSIQNGLTIDKVEYNPSTQGYSLTQIMNQTIAENTEATWRQKVIIDRRDRHTLYTNYLDVFKTTDGGVSWTNITNGTLGNGTTAIEYMYQSPSHPDIFILGWGSEMRKSTDGGVTWSTITSPGFFISYQNQIVIHPTNPDIMWIGHFFVRKTVDGGMTWTDYTGSIPISAAINTIAYQEGTADGLYVAGKFGQIYYRDNTMNDWVLFNTNLPNVWVQELEVLPEINKVRAATWGRGIWESPTFSNSVNFCDEPAPPILTTEICGEIDPVIMAAQTAPSGYTLYWYKDGVELTGENATTITSTSDAIYQARYLDDNGTCHSYMSDPLKVVTRPAVVINGGTGVSFDGADDYISVPSGSVSLSQSTAFTVEFWGQRAAYNSWDVMAFQNDLFIGFNGAKDLVWGLKGNDVAVPSALIDLEWHHFAFVFDPSIAAPSDNRFIYLDGVVVASARLETSFSTSGEMRLGKSFGDHFLGSLDEFRVWNTARTPAELQANMFCEPACINNDLALYLPFENGTANGDNTAAATTEDYSLKGAVAVFNNFTLTGTASNYTTGVDVAIYADSDGDGFGGNTVWTCGNTAARVLGSNDCDDNDANINPLATEICGNNIDDDCDGITDIEDNLAVNFDNTTNNKIDIPVVDYTGDFAFECWFTHQTAGGITNIIRYQGANDNWELGTWDNELGFLSNNNGWRFAGSVAGGQWHHLVLNYRTSDNNVKIYLDGTLALNVNRDLDFEATATGIGYDTGSGRKWDGSLDEIRIWDRQLTEGEISDRILTRLVGNEADLLRYYPLDLGTAGGDNSGITIIKDHSSAAQDGTMIGFALNGNTSNWVAGNIYDPLYLDGDSDGYGSTTVWTCGSVASYVTNNSDCDDNNANINPGAIEICGNNADDNCDGLTDVEPDNALHFDGGGHRMDIPNIVYGTNLTFEAWIKMTPADQGGFYRIIEWSGGTSPATFAVDVSGRLGYFEGGGIVNGSSVHDNQWHHVALVREGVNIKTYLDGNVLLNHNGFTGDINNTQLVIGDAFKGLMEEARYWSTSLTQAEIADRMNYPLNGDETGLVRYYPLNQGVADADNSGLVTVLDKTTNQQHGTLGGFVLNGNTSNWVAGKAYDPLYLDGDSDDFGGATTWTCGSITNYVTNNLDINDNDVNINPNAVEICGNNIDENGNGVIDENTLALHLDGNDDAVDLGTTLGNFSTGDFTVEMQVKTSSKNRFIISKRATCDGNNSFWDVIITSDGNVTVELFSGSGGPNSGFSTTGINVADGNFHHIAISRENGICKIYVDGSEAASTYTLANLDNTTNLFIGPNVCTQFGTLDFEGTIDELRFWDHARSADDIDFYKNAFLPANSTGLIAYHDFNNSNAVADQNNTGQTTFTDLTGNYTGTLSNFALNGTASNWVGNPTSNCATCNITPALANSSPACEGENITLTATPANEVNYHFFADTNQNGTVENGESLQDGASDTYTANNLNDGDVISVLIGNCTTAATTTVTVNAAPSLTITDPAPVCDPNTVDLTAASVTAGSDSGTLAYFTDSNLSNPVPDPTMVGAGTYYIELTDGNGCVSSSAVVVTVHPTPTLVITDPAPVCDPSTVDLTAASITAGSDAGTLAYFMDSNLSNPVPDPTMVGAGTYYIELIDGNGCVSSSAVVVTVHPTPTLVITDPAPVCDPSTVDLTDPAVTSGSDAGTLAYFTDSNLSNPVSDPTTVGAGTYYIELTDDNGCVSSGAVVVTVHPNPTLVITDPTPVCDPSTVDLTNPAVTSGSDAGTLAYFTDSNLSNPVSDPTMVGAGTYYIELTDGNGCVSSSAVVVTVHPNPTLIITDPAPVCDPSTVDLTDPAVTTGSDSGTLAYFTDSNLSNVVPDPTVVGAGTFYIELTDGNGCVSSGAVVVTINASPTLVITDPDAVCSPNTTDLTAASVTAGSDSGTLAYFTDSNLSNSVGDPTQVGIGTYYIRLTDANGCVNSSSVVVSTITSGIAVSNNVNDEAIPNGDNTPTLAKGTAFDSPTTSTFKILNDGSEDLIISNITIDNTTDFTLTQAGNSTVMSSGNTTFTIAFNPQSAGTKMATVTIENNTCDNDPYTFVVTGTDNSGPCTFSLPTNVLDFDGTNDRVECGNFSFYQNSFTIEGWINTLDNSNGAYIFHITNGSGTAVGVQIAGDNLNVIVRNPPGSSGGFGISSTSTVRDGSWHHFALVKEDNDNFKIYIDGVLETERNNTGGDYTTSYDVILGFNAPGSPRYFDGQMDEIRMWDDARTQAEIQANKDVELTGTEANLVAYYNFNQGIADGDNTGEMTLIDQTGNGHNGTLIDFALMGISSNWSAPAPVGNLTMPILQNNSPVCEGADITFNASSGGTNYEFFVDVNTNGEVDNNESLQNGTSNIYTANNLNDGDIISVVVTDGNGCDGTATSSVTINVNPTLVITNPDAVCDPSTADLTAAAVTAGSDSGTLAYFTDSNLSNVVPDPTMVGAGTYYIELTDGNGCVSSGAVVVTTHPTPTLVITDPDAVCDPNTADLTAASVTAGSDVGTLAYFMDSNLSNPVPDPTMVGVGTYYIELTDGNGCVSSGAVVVTTHSSPTLIITDPDAVCDPNTADLTAAAVTAGSDAGTLAYFTDSNLSNPVSDPTIVGAGTYYIELTDGNGCISSGAVVVTTHPSPTLIITDPDAVCEPNTADLTAAAVTAGSDAGTLAYFTDSNLSNPVPDPTMVGAGTYYIELTDGNGCVSSDAVVVTTHPNPTLVITDPDAVCDPNTADLTATSVTAGSDVGTLAYFTDSNLSNPVPDPTMVGAGTYYIELTDGNGCVSSSAVVVTVHPNPTLVITDPDPVCEPNTADLTAASVTAGSDSGTLAYFMDSNLSNPVPDPTMVGAGTYYIELTDGNGCISSGAVVVTTHPNPTLVITDPDPVCDPNTADLTAASVTAGSDAGTLAYFTDSNLSNPVPDPTMVGAGTYYIELTDGNGCVSSGAVVVTEGNCSGPAGAALDFDGADDQVSFSGPFISTSVLTYEAWVNPRTEGAFRPVIYNRNVNSGFWISDGELRYNWNGNSGTSLWAVETGVMIPTNTWTHVAMVVESNKVSFYKNGAVAFVYNNSHQPSNISSTTHLGVDPGAGVFDGQLDEVRIWHAARTCEEINYYKDCELAGMETGLRTYFQFNEGIADGGNPSETNLPNLADSNRNGTLNNFALSGSTSNWIATGGVMSGNTCTGTPIVPEIVLQGGANPVDIANGDTTPDTADDTDFGMPFIGSTVDHTFTIQNTGTGDLNLTGTPIVAVSGASEFTVETQPTATSIASGGSDLTFVVRYAPTTVATHTATISIISNDCSDSPYTFRVTGTGTTPPPATALHFDGVDDYVVSDNNVALFGNTPTTFELWVNPSNPPSRQFESPIGLGRNRIYLKMTNPLRLHGESQFADKSFGYNLPLNTWTHIAVTYDGVDQVKLYINGNPAPNPSYTQTIAAINDKIYLGDRGDLNSAFFWNGAVDEVRVWQEERTAAEILANYDTELTDVNPCMPLYFKLNQGTSGVDNTGITTANGESLINDGTLNNFALNGATSNWTLGAGITEVTSSTDAYAEIAVDETTIGTDFGAQVTNSTTTLAYTITNTGGSDLNVMNIMSDAAEFNIANFTASAIPANGTLTFDVDFTPTAETTYSAIISIENDDCDENPYLFEVAGVGAPPPPATALHFDGEDDVVVSQNDVTLFGSKATTVEFWIKNEDVSGHNGAIGIANEKYFFYPNFNGTSRFVHVAGDWYNFGELIPNDVWTHVAVTYDGVGTMRGYVNGMPAANPTQSRVWASVTGPVYVGTRGANGPYWKGGMDEVRIWEEERTATDILANYDTEIADVNPCMPTYFKFNQGTSGVDNTGITTANGESTINDGTLNNFALNGETSNWIVGADITEVTSSTDAFPEITVDEMNVGTDFGNQAINTTSNSLSYTITNIGGNDLDVMDITSNDPQFMVHNFSPTLISNNGTLTFDVDFTPNSLGSKSATISIFSNDCDENPYTFTVTGTGVGLPEMDVLGNSNSIMNGDNTPDINDFTDFGTQLTNSITDRTFTIRNTGSGTLDLTGTPIVEIFGPSTFTVETQPTASSIASGGDDLTFVVRYIPTSESVDNVIVSISNNDSDENPYTFTLMGIGEEPIPVGALNFDGTDDQVVASLASASTDFTIEATFKANSAAGGFRTIMAWETGVPVRATSLAVNNDGFIRLGQFDYDNSNFQEVIGNTFVKDDEWHHVAAVKLGNEWTLYVDGVADGTITLNPQNQAFAGLTDLRIGHFFRSNGTVGAFFSGDIDEVRVWDRSLCQEEIMLQKDCALTGTETGLRTYYDFLNTNATVDGDNTGETILTDLAGNSDGMLSNFTLMGNTSNWIENYVSGACTPYSTTEIAVDDETVGTDFGTQLINTTSNPLTYTITNVGDEDLDVMDVMSSDPQFVISNFTAGLVATNGTLSFDIDFTPNSLGARFATITIVSDDCNEGTYTFTVQGTGIPDPTNFVTTWEVEPNDLSIFIPTQGGDYNYTVNWGDGTSDANQTANASHTYDAPGSYTVSISGDFPHFYLNGRYDTPNGNHLKIRSIDQWGTQQWRSMESAFAGATNLVYNANDAPDLSNVSTAYRMFYGNRNIGSPDLTTWEVGNINIFWDCFNNSNFNGDLSNWNMSNATNIRGMFQFSQFNGDISNWNTANVTNMIDVFASNAAFNQDISNWNMSSVTNTTGMFYRARSFNQPLNNWERTGSTTANITTAARMFREATSFNQDLNQWNVSGLTDMTEMFMSALSFNGDVSNWNTANVSSMRGTFFNARSFDQNLGGWDVTALSGRLALWIIFTYTPMSTANYDATLIGWAAQNIQESSIYVGVHGLKYCAGRNAREALKTQHRWAFIGDGLDEAQCSDLPFVTTWITTQPNESITIFTNGRYSYNYNINWGDGNVDNGRTGATAHVFATPGVHQVEITGDFPHFTYGNSTNARKLRSVEQWGSIKWRDMSLSFFYAENMVLNAVDAPDLSQVISMYGTFAYAKSLNADLNHWNVSKVRDMNYTFYFADQFNGDIGKWDVSNVNTMNGMFYYARAFNQDLSSWDISNVQSMYYMFLNAINFDQDLSAWDFSNLTYSYALYYSFYQAGLGVNNYDRLLQRWRAQAPQMSRMVGGSMAGLEYCNAEVERAELLSNFNWSFGGDNRANSCSALVPEGITEGLLTVPIGDSPIDFSVFPNPAGNYVSVAIGATVEEVEHIEVTDQLGRVIWTQPIIDTAQPIEISLTDSKFSTGIYFVSLKLKDDVLTKRLMINK